MENVIRIVLFAGGLIVGSLITYFVGKQAKENQSKAKYDPKKGFSGIMGCMQLLEQIQVLDRFYITFTNPKRSIIIWFKKEGQRVMFLGLTSLFISDPAPYWYFECDVREFDDLVSKRGQHSARSVIDHIALDFKKLGLLKFLNEDDPTVVDLKNV